MPRWGNTGWSKWGASAAVLDAGEGGGGGPPPPPTPVYTRTFSTQTYDGLFDALGTNDGAIAFSNPGEEIVDPDLDYPARTWMDVWLSSNQYFPWLATDQTKTTFAHTDNFGERQWSVDFGPVGSVTINHYAIHRREASNAPQNWVLRGSNDGETWTVIDTQVANSTLTTQDWVDIAVTESGPWRFLQIDGGDSYLILGGVEFWGDFFEVGSPPATWFHAPYIAPRLYRDLFDAIGTIGRTTRWDTPENVGVAFSALTEFSASYDAGNISNRQASNASGDGYSSASGSAPGQWVQADFGPLGMEVTIDGYAIRDRIAGGSPRSWKLQGSSDGSAWTDIDSQTSNTDLSGIGTWFETPVTPSGPWRYVRILQTGVNVSGDDVLNIGDLLLFGAATPVPPFDGDTGTLTAAMFQDPPTTNDLDAGVLTAAVFQDPPATNDLDAGTLTAYIT